MKKLTHIDIKKSLCLLGCILLSFIFGCSSGDNASEGPDQIILNSHNEKGTVAVLIADGPADEFDKLWVWIKSVSLIPADDDTGPVVIFESDDPEGYKVDLLDLRDQDFILTVNENVPPGVYAKIRLHVLDVQPEGNNSSCAELEVKLPGGKIDLNPRTNFEVLPGGELAIRLDLDVDKSMRLHVAGHSGKCIFSPVIFVEIDTDLSIPDHCPKVLSGTFSGFIYEDDDDTKAIIGFKLDLGNGRGIIKILFKDETIIFSEKGMITGIDSLPDTEELHVRGRLNSEGCFMASEIVIGGVEAFKGVVSQSTPDTITLVLANDAGEIDITLSPDTVILIGCDTPFEGNIIPPDSFVRAYGKFDTSEETPNLFRALLILIKPLPVISLLTNIDDVEGGYNLTISNNGGPEFLVFLPAEAVIKIEGDGFVDIDRLKEWLDCKGRMVKVVYDTEISDPLTAEKLIVVPEVFTGALSEKNFSIEKNATIFELAHGQQRLIEIDEVDPNAQVIAYGVETCGGDADFYVFVLIVLK